ncbi:hypothetical protein [Synechococcus sp. MIT S1220]|uniref:hypothetical protein n=1 Tax=Synechococcus sp. MIT S1220 TaxID=3082549 RepID=UPI0039B05B3A
MNRLPRIAPVRTTGAQHGCSKQYGRDNTSFHQSVLNQPFRRNTQMPQQSRLEILLRVIK